MENASTVLVIIVSSVLTVFLVVAIILGIYLVKLTAEIRRIARTAQKTVNTIESAASGVGKLVSPMFMADFIARTVKKYTKGDKKK